MLDILRAVHVMRGVPVLRAVHVAVQALGAPPEVLQRLKEGAFGPFFLQSRPSLLFHLRDLSEGHRLRLKARLPGSARPALSSGGRFGDGQLLRELLHHRGQEVGAGCHRDETLGQPFRTERSLVSFVSGEAFQTKLRDNFPSSSSSPSSKGCF